MNPVTAIDFIAIYRNYVPFCIYIEQHKRACPCILSNINENKSYLHVNSGNTCLNSNKFDGCIQTESKPPQCLRTFNQGTLLDCCQKLTIYLHFVMFHTCRHENSEFCKGMSDNTQNLF